MYQLHVVQGADDRLELLPRSDNQGRAIRSWLSTQGTSKTSEDEFNGLVDVRLAASRDSSRLLAGHGEHLVAFGCDAGLRGGQDVAVASLRLLAERLHQIERGPARLARGQLPLPFRGLPRCPILSFRFLDSQERFRFAHMGTVRENWASFKRFSYGRRAIDL